MLFAIICEDVIDSLELRTRTRPQHLERLIQLEQQNRLTLAGPHPIEDPENPDAIGFSGSLIVADFENLAAAQAWADNDPYRRAGIYQKVTVKPFVKVLP